MTPPALALRYRANALQCLEEFVRRNPRWRELLPPAVQSLAAAVQYVEMAAAVQAEGGADA